jgi:hypothetical protein
MNQAAAAATQQRKRVRLSDDNDNAPTTQTATGTASERKTIPPKSLAIDLISQHCETLQPKLADMLRKAGIAHLNTMIKEQNKQIQIKKLKHDDAFFPKSISLQFELRAAKEVKEDPEFAKQEEKATEIVLQYKKEMKKVIQATAELEYKQLHDSMRNELCRAYRLLIQAFLVHEDSQDNLDATVYHAITKNADALLAPFDMSKQAFILRYTQVHGLSEFPVMTTVQIGEPTASRHFNTQPSQLMEHDVILMTQFDFAACVESLKAVFNVPWKKYLTTWSEKEADLRLAKFAAENITAKSTADAAEVADREQSVEPERLVELIEKGIAKRTKQLEKEVNQLRQQLTNNNTQQNSNKQKNLAARGRSKSPRTKKQKSNEKKQQSNEKETKKSPRRRSQSPGKSNAAKAAGSNRDTKKGRQNKNQNNGNSKKKPGQSGRNSGRSKSPARSTRK